MKVVVFGAGKIARGFIGHLLDLSGFSKTFVDANEELVSLLNHSETYKVHIMGNEAKNHLVRDFNALHISDRQAIADQWNQADLGFVSVGGKNLASLGQIIAEAFQIRSDQDVWTTPFNFILCENWKEPAKVLKEAIHSHLPDSYITLFDQWVGLTEAVVMRSGVEPPGDLVKDDPLCVCVSDYWELPINQDRWKGERIPIQGLKYISNFSGFLERKFYTYNAANGTVSYLGYLRGHQYIYEAAMDPMILSIMDKVYQETGKALAKKHHISEQDQYNFAMSSKRKLQDRNIIDYVERNARDPLRKLGPDDRLIGSARLALKYGIIPHALALAAAAAIYYDKPEDPSARKLCLMRNREGIDAVLKKVCQLDPNGELAELIKEKIVWLRKEDLIS